MFRKLLFCFSLITILCYPIFATEYEIQLENQMTQKVQTALDGVYGKGNFIVRIDLSLTAPRYEVKYTKESSPQLKKKEAKGGEYNILPGYPVIKNLGQDDLKRLPFDSVTNYINPRVISRTVTLIINKSFSRGQVGRAETLIREILGMSAREKINMTFVKFYEAPPENLITLTIPQQLMQIQNILLMVGLLFFLIFIVLYIIMSIKSAKAAGGASGPNISVNPNIELPESGGGGGGSDISVSGEPKIKKYFDFINDDNIDKLIYLIKKENISSENVATIISFLSPKLGSKLLGEFDIKNQAAMAANMLNQKMVNRQFIEKLETKIKDWLECLTGGESIFQRVFGYVSGEVKKQMLGILSSGNPEAYRKFRKNVVIFDDLKYLDDEEIKKVLSDANVELLSTALVSVDDATYQKIDANLTGSAKDMIKQFLDLKGQTISKKDIESAQEYILKIVSKLEDEGKIDLKSKVAG